MEPSLSSGESIEVARVVVTERSASEAPRLEARRASERPVSRFSLRTQSIISLMATALTERAL